MLLSRNILLITENSFACLKYFEYFLDIRNFIIKNDHKPIFDEAEIRKGFGSTMWISRQLEYIFHFSAISNSNPICLYI